jgi:membrane-bound serine protease (ClpP class)
MRSDLRGHSVRTRSIPIVVLGLAVLSAALARQGTGSGRVSAVQPPADANRPVAAVLHITGAIGPATSHYVQRGLATAESDQDRLVILEMDTPGGLDSSMRDIIQAILASPIPVVGYVSPPGARAASAGTYILYACEVAAMAPATNLGAATPVEIGGQSTPQPAPASPIPGSPTPGSGAVGRSAQPHAGGVASGASASSGETLTTMERKEINDAVAYIRGLAELRGRNADWAEQAVRGAASLPASVAVSNNVVDLIARDLPDLLEKLNGRSVKMGTQTIVLDTRGVTPQQIEPDWRTRLLAVITHPTVAYGLMLIGIYGLLLEGYNPGAMLPGVVGAISLLIALFAFQILSVNYAGLALIAVGVGMIIGEFFFPTYGSLGIGGLIAFVVGSIILFDTDTPGLRLALPLIAGVATAGGLILVGLVYFTTRSLRRPVVTGREAMVGATAEAFEDFAERGRVRLGGELWNAHTSAPLTAGQTVRIVRVEGLMLWVEPA